MLQPDLFSRFPVPPRHLTHDQADSLARSVTRFVHKQAHYWATRFRKDADPSDLHEEFVSAGWAGVARALSTFNPDTPNPFDPTRRIKFMTYCFRPVNNSMRHLAKQMGARHARSGPIRSLSSVVTTADTPFTLADDLPSPAPSGWTQDDWRDALSILTPLQRRAVRFRFYHNMTLDQVKRRLPPTYFRGRRRLLSKQGVANLIDRALARLREIHWLQHEAGVS